MIPISKHDTFLCGTEKGGNRLNSGETKRERERERETECCSKRVLAWAINLAVVHIFMTAR